MNRERLPLVWWLAAIPMVAIAASSYVFRVDLFLAMGTAAWVWFGAPSSSPRRKVTVNVMTIVIYGIGLALPLPGLGPATPERLLVAFGITAVLLIAHFVYLAAKLTKYVPDTSGSSLFTDRDAAWASTSNTSSRCGICSGSCCLCR